MNNPHTLPRPSLIGFRWTEVRFYATWSDVARLIRENSAEELVWASKELDAERERLHELANITPHTRATIERYHNMALILRATAYRLTNEE